MEISGDEARKLLEEHRRTIDNLDAALIHIFAEKFFAFIVAEVIRHHERIADEFSH